MRLFRLLLSCVLVFHCIIASAQHFVPVPPLAARVTDMAGMLNAGQKATLENVLKEYEDRTGSQIAILLINKTEPEAIEQYGIRVFDAWKLGRKGIDDGVLLLVAKDNPPALRRLRIEAGRGVQGVLTDAQSKRILQDVIAPHFRQNDFYGGLVAGISATISLLYKEKFPLPEDKKGADAAEDEFDGWSLFLLFGFMLLFMVLSRFRSAQRYLHGRNGWGRSGGIILGGGLGSGSMGGFGGFGGGSSGGGGFSGGGGSADGGGASGNW